MSKLARILVIDDDPLFRSLIVSLLRKDFMVSVASEGSEGFYKALEHPPDLAVVDIKMPGWDGLKTLKAFRNHPSLSHVKIVILISDTSQETVLSAIHGGVNDYVIKSSFSKEEFYRKLEKLLTTFTLPSGDASVVELPKTQTPIPVAEQPPKLRLVPKLQLGNKAELGNEAPASRPTVEATSALDSHDDEAHHMAFQEMIDGWE